MIDRNYLLAGVFVLAMSLAMRAEADEPVRDPKQADPIAKQEQQAQQKSDCGCSHDTEDVQKVNVKGVNSFGSCICDKYPIYDLGDGAWLFMAEYYDSCANCVNPLDGWDVESSPYHSNTCPNCHGVGISSALQNEVPQLSERKPWGYNKSQFFTDLYQQNDIKELPNLKLDYTVEGDGKTIEFFINGHPIYARIFLISVKPDDSEPIVAGLGVEIDPPPSTTAAGEVMPVSHVASHQGWKHGYDVQIGFVTYLVITAQ